MRTQDLAQSGVGASIESQKIGTEGTVTMRLMPESAVFQTRLGALPIATSFSARAPAYLALLNKE